MGQKRKTKVQDEQTDAVSTFFWFLIGSNGAVLYNIGMELECGDKSIGIGPIGRL